MLVRQAAITDEYTMYYVCLLIHQQVIFATFIVYPDSRPRRTACSQCRLDTANIRHETNRQPQTELVYAAIIRRCYVLAAPCPLCPL